MDRNICGNVGCNDPATTSVYTDTGRTKLKPNYGVMGMYMRACAQGY